MKNFARGLVAATSLIALFPAAAAVVTVTSPSGTFTNPTSVSTSGPGIGYDRWFANNVRSGAAVGITGAHPDGGNGSVTFTAPSNSNAKADFEYYFSSGNGFALSTLNAFSYDYLRSSTSMASAKFMPALRLYVSDGSHSGYLIYENIYNGVPVSPLDTFSTVDVMNKRVWGTGSLPGAFANYDRTIADWVALLPNLQVLGLSFGIGSGWDGAFEGAVDNVTFGRVGSESTTFDFELAQTAAVPETATWAMMIGGFGMIGASLRRRARTTVRFS